MVDVAVGAGVAPLERGDFETVALKRARTLEDGVSRRAQVRVDALEIAQNVQIERVRLDGLRRPLAQARQIPLGGRELALPQLCFCRDQLTSNVQIARHEDSDRELQIVDDLLMEFDEIGLALLGKGDAAPDLLGRKVHQILVDDVADVLEIHREGNDLHCAVAVAVIQAVARHSRHVQLDRLIEAVDRIVHAADLGHQLAVIGQ